MVRDVILFRARLSVSGRAVKFPVVPGADDVIAVEGAFAERPRQMIADSGDGAEGAVLIRNREADSFVHDFSEGSRFELFF